ncbi:MAG: hypothetical protein Q9159_001753 [Coniocarpon cinnabarinum]
MPSEPILDNDLVSSQGFGAPAGADPDFFLSASAAGHAGSPDLPISNEAPKNAPGKRRSPGSNCGKSIVLSTPEQILGPPDRLDVAGRSPRYVVEKLKELGYLWSEGLQDCSINLDYLTMTEAGKGHLVNSLLWACDAGHLPVVDAVLGLGADPNFVMQSNVRLTPLLIASKRGFHHIVERLLRADEAVDLCSQQDKVCIYKSPDRFFQQTVSVRFASSSGTPLNMVMRNQGVGKDIHGSFSALWYAAFRGDIETVTVLLRAGSAVNQGFGDMGLTPLMIACLEGHATIAKLLLLANANPAMVASAGPASNAMALTALYGHVEVIRVLLDTASVARHINEQSSTERTLQISPYNGQGRKHETPLHTAILCYTPDAVSIIKLLVESGADVHLRSSSGWTPLELAIIIQNLSKVQALLPPDSKLPSNVPILHQVVWPRWHNFGEQKDAIRCVQAHGANNQAEHWSARTAFEYRKWMILNEYGFSLWRQARQERGRTEEIRTLLMEFSHLPEDSP